MVPRFVGPFPIQRVIVMAAVRVQLPRSIRVHLTFHISKVNPALESPLVPACPLPLLIDGGPAFTL